MTDAIRTPDGEAEPHAVVEISVPQGALSERRKAGLVDQATSDVLEATAAAPAAATSDAASPGMRKLARWLRDPQKLLLLDEPTQGVAAHARRDIHVFLREAARAGVRILVDSDAHSTVNLGLLRFGIDTARRAWLTAGDVANTLPWREFKALRR